MKKFKRELKRVEGQVVREAERAVDRIGPAGERIVDQIGSEAERAAGKVENVVVRADLHKERDRARVAVEIAEQGLTQINKLVDEISALVEAASKITPTTSDTTLLELAPERFAMAQDSQRSLQQVQQRIKAQHATVLKQRGIVSDCAAQDTSISDRIETGEIACLAAEAAASAITMDLAEATDYVKQCKTSLDLHKKLLTDDLLAVSLHFADLLDSQGEAHKAEQERLTERLDTLRVQSLPSSFLPPRRPSSTDAQDKLEFNATATTQAFARYLAAQAASRSAAAAPATSEPATTASAPAGASAQPPVVGWRILSKEEIEADQAARAEAAGQPASDQPEGTGQRERP